MFDVVSKIFLLAFCSLASKEFFPNSVFFCGYKLIKTVRICL